MASRVGVLGPRKMPTPVMPTTPPVSAHEAGLGTAARAVRDLACRVHLSDEVRPPRGKASVIRVQAGRSCRVCLVVGLHRI